jgi:sugar phosphate isomerase/epimerase
MARLASEIGFTGIDLTVRSGGHVQPENAKRDLPEAVGRIRDEGLEVPMITTGITDPEDPDTMRILETAGKLNIPIYRTGWYRYQKGTGVEEQLMQAAKKLGILQEVNRSTNMTASYQNHAGDYMGSSGWDLLRMIEGLDPRWIGVQFDIRHAMVEGPESWPIILELLAPYINSIDIKDFTWVSAEGGTGQEATIQNVPLGKGLVPFETFFQQIKELDIRVDFSVHYEYPLGGAEHGGTNLEISRDVFSKQVGTDLQYLKSLL